MEGLPPVVPAIIRKRGKDNKISPDSCSAKACCTALGVGYIDPLGLDISWPNRSSAMLELNLMLNFTLRDASKLGIREGGGTLPNPKLRVTKLDMITAEV
jgi:hypothetical protein